MTKLDCNVVNCSYNADNCCRRTDIQVEGTQAKTSSETCCGSFAPKGSGCQSCHTTDVKKDTTVSCEACECKFNEDHACHAGDFFGEPYAASQRAVLNISVVADEDCEIILLNVKRLLITCPTACEHHQKLIRNLVSVLAKKILILNDKITHVGKRTTRDKLLSYLSAESIRHSSLSFDIPFDRQQLADYLCIDRAAMSTEISKLQKEGFIKTNRNHFELQLSIIKKKNYTI